MGLLWKKGIIILSVFQEISIPKISLSVFEWFPGRLRFKDRTRQVVLQSGSRVVLMLLNNQAMTQAQENPVIFTRKVGKSEKRFVNVFVSGWFIKRKMRKTELIIGIMRKIKKTRNVEFGTDVNTNCILYIRKVLSFLSLIYTHIYISIF